MGAALPTLSSTSVVEGKPPDGKGQDLGRVACQKGRMGERKASFICQSILLLLHDVFPSSARSNENESAFEYLGNSLAFDPRNPRTILAAGSIIQVGGPGGDKRSGARHMLL